MKSVSAYMIIANEQRKGTSISLLHNSINVSMKDVGLGRLLTSGIEKEYVFGVRFVGGVLEENPLTVDNRAIKMVKNSAIHNNQQFINNISLLLLS